MEIRIRLAPFGKTDRERPQRRREALTSEAAAGPELVQRGKRPALAALSIAILAVVGGCKDLASSKAQQAEPAIYTAGQRIVLRGAQLTDLNGQERQVSSLLNVRTAMNYGDYVWNEEGVPPGDIWMLVDLGAQTISVFRGEHEIGTAVTLYGADQKPTPVGRYAILEKRKDHWSNLYDAPMPYTLRLTYDGIAIHGAAVLEGAATHGCLGVPIDFARRLFEVANRGDEVLVLRDVRSHVASGVG